MARGASTRMRSMNWWPSSRPRPSSSGHRCPPRVMGMRDGCVRAMRLHRARALGGHDPARGRWHVPRPGAVHRSQVMRGAVPRGRAPVARIGPGAHRAPTHLPAMEVSAMGWACGGWCWECDGGQGYPHPADSVDNFLGSSLQGDSLRTATDSDLCPHGGRLEGHERDSGANGERPLETPSPITPPAHVRARLARGRVVSPGLTTVELEPGHIHVYDARGHE